MKVAGHPIDKLHLILLTLLVITIVICIKQMAIPNIPATSSNNYTFMMAKYHADSLILMEKYDDALAAYTDVDAKYPNNINLPAITDFISQKKQNSADYQHYIITRHDGPKANNQPYSNKNTSAHSKQTKTIHNSNSKSPSGDTPPIGNVTKEVLKITNFDGASISYIGEVKNGKANGYGVAVFNKKGFYEGQWANNLCNGEGTYYWQNGDTYSGHYIDGYKTGYGVYTFVTGEKYEGYWKNNLRHGEGTLKNKRGKVVFQGKWENNEPIEKKKKKKKR